MRGAAGNLAAGVHAVEPDFFRNLDAELVSHRSCLDRAVVLAYAVLTGLVVVGSTLLAEGASHLFDSLRTGVPGGPWLALLQTPLHTVAIVWFTREHVPGAAGTGIPQVMRALDVDLVESDRNWLVSLRFAFHKVVLVAGGMLAGLSIGHEGPMVQVGTDVMGRAWRWLSPGSGIDRHDLMVLPGLVVTLGAGLGGGLFARLPVPRPVAAPVPPSTGAPAAPGWSCGRRVRIFRS